VAAGIGISTQGVRRGRPRVRPGVSAVGVVRSSGATSASGRCAPPATCCSALSAAEKLLGETNSSQGIQGPIGSRLAVDGIVDYCLLGNQPSTRSFSPISDRCGCVCQPADRSCTAWAHTRRRKLHRG
jgi:hypothetical protein